MQSQAVLATAQICPVPYLIVICRYYIAGNYKSRVQNKKGETQCIKSQVAQTAPPGVKQEARFEFAYRIFLRSDLFAIATVSIRQEMNAHTSE